MVNAIKTHSCVHQCCALLVQPTSSYVHHICPVLDLNFDSGNPAGSNGAGRFDQLLNERERTMQKSKSSGSDFPPGFYCNPIL